MSHWQYIRIESEVLPNICHLILEYREGMLTKFVLTHPNIHCRVSRMDRNLIFERMKTGQIVFALLLLLPSVLPCILSPCWHATLGNYVSCMCRKCCYPGLFSTCCGQLDCFKLCFNTDNQSYNQCVKLLQCDFIYFMY